MTTTTDVLIVGAGPTGLVCAIELQRLGLSARLVDKADHGAAWSQALVVQARTLEQWERYGISDAAVAGGIRIQKAHLVSEGKDVLHLDLSQIPGRYPFVLFYPQNETEALLANHLEQIGGARLERGTRLVSFQQDASGVTARLRTSAAESEHRAAWVIGADGAHSFVREQLGIPFSGESVHLSFLLADLTLEGPDVPSDELVVRLRGGNVVFMAPLSPSVYRVIHATHKASDTEGAITPERFNAIFEQEGIRVRAKAQSWSAPFHVNDRQAARYRVGRALLAGDASHIHSPVGGQGMNTGMQDAANLAWKLAAVHRGAPDALLDSYEAERAEVGRQLLARTGTGLHLATTTNPVVRWLRDKAANGAQHLTAVQHAATGFVSETAIAYRSSPAVEDRGGTGTLHAGDRVPNPSLRNGSRLLDPLKNAAPLVLLCGGVSKEVERGVAARAPRVTVVSIESGESAEVAALFGTGPQLFVVRPDGYLGFRGADSDAERLDGYLARIGA